MRGQTYRLGQIALFYQTSDHTFIQLLPHKHTTATTLAACEYYLPDIDEWIEDDHLARFIVEVLDQLDLSEITRRYGNDGPEAYHPVVLLGILVYGYATGTFSSRKLERATYESVVFRFIASNQQPDHDTLDRVSDGLLASAGRFVVPKSLLLPDLFRHPLSTPCVVINPPKQVQNKRLTI